MTFGPKSGTYGVGQPVTAELDKPVKDKAQRAVVERALRVDAVPAVQGAWHWVDDKELHYRPKEYWPAHATIQVRSDLDGVKIGDRLWGGKAKALKLTTGDSIVAVTDASSHSMTVYKNGEDINELPVTTGKPGFETRNGVKVVLGKEYFVRMRGTTRRHRRGLLGLVRPARVLRDPRHLERRVRARRPLVRRLPGLRQRQPRLHRHEHQQRRVVLRHRPRGRRGEGRQLDGDTMEPFGNGFGDWNLDLAELAHRQRAGSGTRRHGPDAADCARAVSAPAGPGASDPRLRRGARATTARSRRSG